MPGPSLRSACTLLVLLLIVTLGLAFTPSIQTLVAHTLANRVLRPTGITVELSNLRVRPNGRVTLGRARVYDSTGAESASLEALSLRVRIRSLFAREFHVIEVEARRAELLATDRIRQDIESYPGSEDADSDWSTRMDRFELTEIAIAGLDDAELPEFRAEATGFTSAGGAFALEEAMLESDADDVSARIDGQADEIAIDARFSLSKQTLAGLNVDTEGVSPEVETVSGDVAAEVSGTAIQVARARVQANNGMLLHVSGSVDAEEYDADVDIHRVEAAGYAAHGHVDLHRSGEAAVSGTLALVPEQDLPEVRTSFTIIDLFGASLFDLRDPESISIRGSVDLPGYLTGRFELEPERPRANAQFDVIELPEVLVDAVPGVPRMQSLRGEFTLDGERLTGELSAEALTGDGYELESPRIEADGQIDNANYSITVGEIAVAQARAYNTVIEGSLIGRETDFTVSTEDEAGDGLFSTGMRVSFDDDRVSAAFSDAGLVVRERQWSIPENNEILFDRGEVQVTDMMLEQAGSRIRVQAGDGGERVTIDVTDFDLSSQIPLELEVPVSGFLNTSLSARLEPDPRAEFELEIRDLAIDELPAGDLSISGTAGPAIRADLGFSQEEGELAGSLRFDPRDEELSVDAELRSLDLSLLKRLDPEEIRDASGTVSGAIRLSGTPLDPRFSGNLSLDNASVLPSRLGVRYRLDATELTLEERTLRVDGLTFSDDTGGQASLSGTLSLDTNPEDIGYDLTLAVEEFTVIDVDESANPDIYGILRVGGGLNVEGSLAEPVFEGALRIEEGSDIAIELPREGLQSGRGAGIVRFQGDAAENLMSNETEPLIQGIELTASLAVSPDANVTLVIDPRTGDNLQVRGGGDFSIGIEPGGAVDLSGTYTVEDGRYELQFLGLVERSFDLEPGGTITWSGAFEEAALDLAAEYSIRTSPAPLLDEADGVAAPSGNLRFLVALELGGTLLQPDIRLALDMPEDERSALGGRPYTAIRNINLQESRRNTQAFALVVLNQFLQDDVTTFDESAALEAGTRNSVSEFLTLQLNLLSQQVVPGLDLAFDVDSFEEATEEGAEGRTEVDVQLRQQLLEDRLIVRFGGQFDVESAGEQTVAPADIGTDASVDYVLTEDRQFRIRAFFERNPGTDNSGTVTGLSFIFGREFDPYTDGESSE
ncbi:MAG: translocation/assembly module TamB domain-containing protein [Spirochaetaceae bacterium]